MNEKDVAFFGTLLNETEENVKTFAEQGTLGEKIAALNLMNQEQVSTMKENYAKEVRSNHLTELVEAVKKGDLPQELYKPIHGAALEMKEKALSKKYEVVDFDGFDDLVEKAISKNKGQSDDKRVQEMETLIEQLKGQNKTLVKEKEEAEVRIKNDFESQIMNRDMSDYVSRVPFDFSDVEEDKLSEAEKSRKEILQSVFASRYNTAYVEGKIIVQDKEGNVIKDRATLEPVPVANVLLDVAKSVGMKLKSPESGGQGGSSSGASGARFKDVAEYYAYCTEKGINPHSDEALEQLKKSGLKLY